MTKEIIRRLTSQNLLTKFIKEKGIKPAGTTPRGIFIAVSQSSL